MKRKILYLITTILIIGVVMFSLPFSVYAEELYMKYAFDSLSMTYSATNNVVYGGLALSSEAIPENGATTSTIVTGEGYDQYISTDFVKAQSEGTFIRSVLTSNGFNNSADKQYINYIGLDAAIPCNNNFISFNPLQIMVNGQIIEDSFIYSVVSTEEGTYTYPTGGFAEQPSYSYYRVKVRIRLNDTFRFQKDDEVKFVLRTEVIPIYDYYSATYKETQYRIGINNLEVGYMEKNVFIENIASDLKDVKDQITVNGNTLNETKDIVNDIYDVLNKNISSDQQAVIDQNNIMIQNRHEMESSLDEEFDNLLDNIHNNDYQMIDGNNFDNGNVDINQNVQDFNSSGMGNFFRSLWELDFIKTAVLLALGFLGIKIGIYGV